MSKIWSFPVRAFLFLGLGGGGAVKIFPLCVWGENLGQALWGTLRPGAVGRRRSILKKVGVLFFFGKSKPPREPQLSIALLFRPREQALRAVLAHKLHRLPIAVARASAAEGLGRGYGVGFYKKAPTKTALKKKRLHIFT